jgi:hypothetical protein
MFDTGDRLSMNLPWWEHAEDWRVSIGRFVPLITGGLPANPQAAVESVAGWVYSRGGAVERPDPGHGGQEAEGSRGAVWRARGIRRTIVDMGGWIAHAFPTSGKAASSSAIAASV